MGPSGTQVHAPPLLTAVAAGIIAGLLAVVLCSSCAALIFSGPLSAHVSAGVGIALFCTCIVGFSSAVTSSYPGTVATVQTEPAALAAVMASTVVSALPPDTPPVQVVGTVVAAIACGTLLTGVFLFALGAVRLGALVRFIPYPVMGGFMAGIGWLLVTGSIALMTDAPAGLSRLPDLFRPAMLAKWGAGLLLALGMLVAQRRSRHPLVMPAVLAASTALFYLVVVVTGTPVAVATAEGWLLSDSPGASFSTLWSAFPLVHADWWVVLGQSGTLCAISLISLVSLLLNASALEIGAECDIDLDRELRTTGAANLVAGLGGGMVGYHSLSLSTLALNMRTRSRLVGLIVAATCALALYAGTAVLSLFPKPVLGGLLMFLGLSFLVNWVYDARSRLPRSDYVVVMLIFITVSSVGYLEGVGIGIVAAVILFVVNYSRINLVRHAVSGVLQQSNVDRPPKHRQVLQEHGEGIHMLKLQGYIFFGSANGLLAPIRERVADSARPPLRFLICDFHRVTGLDTSAAISFVKIRQLGDRMDFVLLFSSAPPEFRTQLAGWGAGRDDGASVRFFPDLDHALEWCEDQLLTSGADDAAEGASHARWSEALPDALAAHLQPYLQRVEISAGEKLIHQGERANDLFFVESGQLSVVLESDGDRQAIRLRKIGPGTVLGELGLYLGATRTASVIADEPSIVYRLESTTLDRMKQEAPELASAFHEYMAHLLAERLVYTNRTLEAVLD
jgi:SulP family sulfate permease